LEQEKYLLRRKFEALSADYEMRVSEFQADIGELHAVLEDQQKLSRANEKEKLTQLTDLTEQNHRLTSELSDACRREERLTLQLQSMKDQYSIRKCVLSDQVNHMENLRDEVSVRRCSLLTA
jgi:coiled-coil domain-containing protein 64